MMRFNRHCRGFSMIELMIAIMILGIGMAMVATVFPIAMDMNRDTLQMSISLAASDAAVATAKLRIPKAADITGDNIRGHFCLVPQRDIKKIEIEGDPDIHEPPAVINEPENKVIKVTDSNSTPPNPTDVWDLPPPLWENNWSDISDYSPTDPLVEPSRDELIKYSRVFTELTGWDAEVNPDKPEMTFVVPAQNIPVDFRNRSGPSNGQPWLVSEINPTIGARPLKPLPGFHLADRLYPPVEVTYRNGDVKDDFQIAYEAGAGFTRNPYPPPDYVEDISKARRYNWTIIHYWPPLMPTNKVDSFSVTIVVTHRGDLNNRYARQKPRTRDPSGSYLNDVFFDIIKPEPEDIKDLLTPGPDDAVDDTTGLSNDMLFPRPWLVMLQSITQSTGTVTCTAQVARLLPPTSQFIFAWTKPGPIVNSSSGMPSDTIFTPGAHRKVLDRLWYPDELNNNDPDSQKPSVLRIQTGIGDTINNVPVWVFPPAIERVGDTPSFREYSPVVGVTPPREVTPE